MNAHAGDGRLLVLYDADCGICTRSVRVLRRIDRRNRLHLMPLQSAPDLVDSPSPDVLLEAIHVRDQEGGWTVASAAWIRIGQEVDILRPLAHLAGLPMMRRLVAWTYGLVAANRYQLSRLLGDDACQTEPRRHDRHHRPPR